MNKFAESDGQTLCQACMNGVDGCCSKHKHITSVGLDEFLMAIKMEILRARMLYPSCEGVVAAMVEEVGEVANAYLDNTRSEIVKEGVQACAMVARLVLEGDPSLANLRAKRKLDK